MLSLLLGAHDEIRKLLGETSAEAEGRCVRISKTREVDGDVSVNLRKGRVRQVFDLKIEFEWTGMGCHGLPVVPWVILAN